MFRSLLPTLIIVFLTVFLACEQKATSPDIVTMQIADRYKACTGEGIRKCMQVKIDDAPNYSHFYGSIDGFTYEEGYTCKLRVKRDKMANPPADASTIRYVLVELISKVQNG